MDAPTPFALALEAQGRSQVWLALQLTHRLGRIVHRQEVGRWMKGSITPEPATQRAIAAVLGLVPEALWSSHGAAGNHADTSSDAAAPGELSTSKKAAA